jgi:hypothetical protein
MAAVCALHIDAVIEPRVRQHQQYRVVVQPVVDGDVPHGRLAPPL